MESFNPFTLSGKQVLVTGASSGIGRSVAVACSKMGASVTITGRNTARLNETLHLMSQGNHQIVSADLTHADEIASLVCGLPCLDGLVHCAGVGSRIPCKQIQQSDIDYVMKPNLEAPILLQSALLSAKKVNKSASVVFIASRAASSPSIGNAIYSASKGALISYARCLALELALRKIRVNCICPAMVWTDLILQDGLTREELEAAQRNYPLKRYGQPEDVANLAVYMLSDASSWMTGSSVDLTGGEIGL